jgi:serine/threonine protein kinase
MIETVPSGTILHGRYRIERVLGSGGFGHVYLAIDQVTRQQYAIKEYLVTGQSGQEQLRHEATVLSQLHHPSLPAYQDAFIERGRYYVVINYIEGNDLTDIIRITRQRNEVVPIPQIMGWTLAVCDAVLFLHSQQPIVIHRDIKPDNIRITSNGTAILVDLGNAKAAADGARTLFFIRHQGTPGYAPPEQYPGGSGTDARSDIYALGATLYFALTAHEPPSVSIRNQRIQQRQPDLPSLQEVLANNPPERADPRQFRPGLKPGKAPARHSRHVAQLGTLPPELLNQLNQIIQRSMAMKPKDRYQYVIDFANDLKKVVEALPVPPSTPSRPLDPNSTQPDLPMLYEALQAAKENDPKGAPPAAPIYCPRCNAPLLPNAVFCSQCGTSLKNSNQAQMSGSSAASSPASGTDISAEKTLLVKLQPQARQKQAQAMQMQTPATYAQNTPRPTNVSNRPLNTPRPHNLHEAPSARNTTSTAQQEASSQNNHTAQANHSQKSNQPSFGLSTNMGLILLLVVIALALALMVILLIVNQGHHADSIHQYLVDSLSNIQ